MYIIDGHNLIGASKEISLKDPDAKTKLLEILAKYQKIMDNKIVVVFDGKTYGEFERSDYENIEVRYSQTQSADDTMLDLIEKYNNQHGISIISSDNKIKDFAKKKHLVIQNSRDFLYEINDTLSKTNEENEAYLTAAETDKWLELFNNR